MLQRDGFAYAFDPAACDGCGGRCCHVEHGTVRVGRGALIALARHLGLAPEAVVEGYLEKRGYGLSLREVPAGDGVACVFYADGCSVYPARPPQCRDYPFWEELREGAGPERCPGVCPRS